MCGMACLSIIALASLYFEMDSGVVASIITSIVSIMSGVIGYYLGHGHGS